MLRVNTGQTGQGQAYCRLGQGQIQGGLAEQIRLDAEQGHV